MAAAADLLVVGAGAAGLTAALHAADLGLSVQVLASGSPVADATSTAYAQGGMAAVAEELGDDLDAHVSDTLAAGAGHCDPQGVRSVLADGPGAVAWLTAVGVDFDRDAAGRPARTREGGHSARRIVHAGGDATGAHVQAALWSAVSRDDRIAVQPGCTVTDVLVADGRVIGVVANVRGREELVTASSVLLATGGLGGLFAATTNPTTSVGSGVALALRAGATTADLEFVQFHPTMFHAPGASGRCLLITEALRGEGARLVDAAGVSVTAGVHPLGDLAPRDVVATAVHRAMAGSGAPCVYLDARGVADVAARFPTVTAGLRTADVDPARDLIPVVPGAHYHCGGVMTDLWGRTDVSGLLAAGEVARTGLHGANRLASNSLTEAVVMGRRVAQAAAQDVAHRVPGDFELVEAAQAARRARARGPRATPSAIRAAMSAGAGVERDAAGLDRTLRVLDTDAPQGGSSEMTLVARAVVTAARQRTESRGCHRRADAPDTSVVDATITVRLDDEGAPVVGSAVPAAGGVDVVHEVHDRLAERVVVVTGSGVPG
ncbi:L-aspartate oxidase [Williamsia deligens]|uniref:L-aspartate oxidase n=1 Tax=Williamsia deligens TaxID=321325 RepID=A0ABW3G5F1_9NOCA|nr:L-aspartate oxidase [Williamsia deligens]MCP2193643.1 L-aspartate oxidase [Williamsia deligens]